MAVSWAVNFTLSNGFLSKFMHLCGHPYGLMCTFADAENLSRKSDGESDGAKYPCGRFTRFFGPITPLLLLA